MFEPFVIEPMMMKDIGDCSICCLKMLLGCSYADIITNVPRRFQKSCLSQGLSETQMYNIARKLGFILEYHDEDFDPDRVGILCVKRDEQQHSAMYFGGAVYNPADGLIFTDLETFLTRGKWTIDGFLFIAGRTK